MALDDWSESSIHFGIASWKFYCNLCKNDDGGKMSQLIYLREVVEDQFRNGTFRLVTRGGGVPGVIGIFLKKATVHFIEPTQKG